MSWDLPVFQQQKIKNCCWASFRNQLNWEMFSNTLEIERFAKYLKNTEIDALPKLSRFSISKLNFKKLKFVQNITKFIIARFLRQCYGIFTASKKP